MIFRKDVLEELGGFDENLAYGEDVDLMYRFRSSKYKTADERIDVYQGLISSLSGVYRQGRWYGKSMLAFYRKYPDTATSILSIFFFASYPIFGSLAIFIDYIGIIFIVQTLLILLYVVDGYMTTKNPFIVFVPLIKVIRSWGELIGITKGRYTDDYGRD